ncbi:MAG: phosphodiesterase [Cyanobacteria bacterium]|nr:phosphodiesterase [Cyanobacteriota bacterium]MDA0864857.1 phosphodiesterase [Cyanobacteriota bacterium]
MLIAQITDLHIQPEGEKAYGIVDTNQFLAAAVAQLNHLNPQPDLVIATGDLVDEGSLAEYQALKALLAPLEAPFYLAMGNHDHRDHFRQVFPTLAYLPPSGPVQYVIEGHPVRLIVLDTLVEGESYGEIDDPRLAWLETALAQAPHQPTVIFMHHPPFLMGIPGMDRSKCRGSEALAAVIRRYPAVQRVACGHVHRSIQVSWAGTVGSVAPSVAHQVALQLTPTSKNAFVMEPPAFHLHLWQPESGLITHTQYIGEFAAYSYGTKEPLSLYA